MSKYRFRLETLKKLREAARDDCRQQLAQALKADQVIENRLNEIDEEFQRLLKAAQEGSRPGVVNVDRLLEVHRYELVLQAEQKQLEHQRKAISTEIDLRRAKLIDADREVRVLEKLREKQHAQHVAEERRLDIRDLDEAGARCGVGEDIG